MSKLANSFYKDGNIKQRVLGEDKNPKQLFPEETLITTLETGHLDAIAAYKHEAIARGLQYITLPAQINLGNPSFSNLYKTVTYILPSGQIVHGEPIYFSVTIPNTYQNQPEPRLLSSFYYRLMVQVYYSGMVWTVSIQLVKGRW